MRELSMQKSRERKNHYENCNNFPASRGYPRRSQKFTIHSQTLRAVFRQSDARESNLRQIIQEKLYSSHGVTYVY